MSLKSLAFVVVLATTVSACGIFRPGVPRTCEIGTIYGCNNGDKNFEAPAAPAAEPVAEKAVEKAAPEAAAPAAAPAAPAAPEPVAEVRAEKPA
jgi:predicted lipid-binding transport protein (Tim44 family)